MRSRPVGFTEGRDRKPRQCLAEARLSSIWASCTALVAPSLQPGGLCLPGRSSSSLPEKLLLLCVLPEGG